MTLFSTGKGFKGATENQPLPSLHRGSLDTMLTFPLNFNSKKFFPFDFVLRD